MNETQAVRQALEDHHHLLALESRLAHRFAESIPCGFEPWIVEIRKEVRELADHLEDHFRREEEDRLHEEIEAAVPNASLQLRKLLDGHATILAQLRGLAAGAEACATPMDGAKLSASASEFFAALDAHERSERELFLRAIEGDQGAPD